MLLRYRIACALVGSPTSVGSPTGINEASQTLVTAGSTAGAQGGTPAIIRWSRTSAIATTELVTVPNPSIYDSVASASADGTVVGVILYGGQPTLVTPG